MLGRRVYPFPDNSFRLEPGDYVKIQDGTFMARVPDARLHAGSLCSHEVIEHEDYTITVSPSILHREEGIGEWHGYLVKGVWKQCK
jgi:hypothetical protein